MMFGAERIGFPGRFARQLFIWFAVATAVPLLLLSGVAYYQVEQNLEQDAERQLHRVAKTIGMYLYARMNELDTLLAPLSSSLFEASRISGVQAVVALDAEAASLAASLSTAEQGALLFVRRDAAGREEILLVPAAWRAAHGWRYAAVLEAEYLQAPEELLPADASYCLVDSANRPVICTGTLSAELLGRVADARHAKAAGILAWQGPQASGLAGYWSIFLRGRFASPDWLVVASRDDADIYASLEWFRSLFPRVLLLALVLAMLLALIQLRLRLKPLGRLVEATRRFARGDFSSRVAADGRDELALLADAFNHMAARTDQQFKRLAGLSELDRLILSSFDEDQIIDSTLARVSELIECDQVAFITLSSSGSPAEIIVRQGTASAEGDGQTAMRVAPGFSAWLTGLAGPVSVVTDELRYWPVAASGGQGYSTLFPVCRQGRSFGGILVHWCSAEQQAEFLGVLHEFSDRLAVALSNAAWEGELFRQAHYDSLTGLANRTLLTDRLEQALLRADRNGSYSALLFVDLDGFKAVNDTLGHQVGDAFLVTAAGRLREAARAADSVVRFGGDEFVVLISDIPPDGDLVGDLTVTAERLIAALSRPVDLAGRQVTLGGSIGIAVYPGDGANASELLRNADAAMYHAKAAGRGHAEFYAEQMNRDALDRMALQQELAGALHDNRGLFLLYQPQLCARSGRPTGVEALVRWRHPTRGVVSPADFVPLAEESGLIVQLGDWVLRQACNTFRALRDAGVDIPRLAVNVAPNQFWTPGFLGAVQDILRDAGLPADVLELEVTEGTVMRDLDRGKELLAQLHAAGIGLSVDDFGTGYSSLSYLQRLPLHALKIDGSFVQGLGDDDASDAIVAAIIALGKRLGLRLVAEGVDAETQADALRELDCDELQGFLFSRPLTEEALGDWWRAHQGETQA